MSLGLEILLTYQLMAYRLYSEYLEFCVQQGGLRVELEVTVMGVTPLASSKSQKAKSAAVGFELETSEGVYTCQFVVWAAGEFQYPAEAPFPGSELCQHNSEVESWEEAAMTVDGFEHVVIGGYESGVDATVNLLSYDKQVTLIGRRASWAERLADPSLELAPYTRQRLRDAREYSADNLQLAGNREVYLVSQNSDGLFTVHTRPAYGTKTRPGRRDVDDGGGGSATMTLVDEFVEEEEELEKPKKSKKEKKEKKSKKKKKKRKADEDDEEEVMPKKSKKEKKYVPWELTCKNPPILANGFQGSVVALIKHLFRWTKPGGPCGTSDAILSMEDESTITPGLFLCGPQVVIELQQVM